MKTLKLYGALLTTSEKENDPKEWVFSERGLSFMTPTHTLTVNDSMFILIPPVAPPKPKCEHNFKTFISSPSKGFEFAQCFDCHKRLVPSDWREVNALE